MHFDHFLKIAAPALDLNWRRYRRRAARHRVQQRLEELGLEDFADYLEVLAADAAEAADLPDRMLVTVSRFFRERQRWENLAGSVLPALRGELTPGCALQAWSAGCCGGEEPYTLAMLWQEDLAGDEDEAPIEILATDIDAASLERAGKGQYRESSLREVPDRMRHRLIRENGLRRVDSRVREAVRFREHNLLEDPPPRGQDLVLCRYLAFTYYRGQRRLAAVRRLHAALRPGGALMIGRKEELGPAAGLFAPWPDAPGVFRRIEHNRHD